METSKLLLLSTGILFGTQVVCAPIFSVIGVDTTVFQYTIPASGGAFGVVSAFYLNKAKMENIFKGKYHYLRMMASFKCKVPQEVFDQIERELKPIDDAYNTKVNTEMTQAVDEAFEWHII